MELVDTKEIEQQLISCILIDDEGDILPKCMKMGIQGHMFCEELKHLWNVMVVMFKHDEDIESVTLAMKAKVHPAEVFALENLRTSNLVWKQFATGLLEAHMQRIAIRTATYIQESIHDEKPENIMTKACQMLEDRPTSSDADTSTKATIEGLQERIKQRKLIGSKVKTGIADIDEVVKIHGGQLVTVAARPGGGKSTELIQMAFESACHWKAAVDLYTLEMATDEVLTKGLACISGVSMNKIGGEFQLPADMQGKLERAQEKIASANLHIYDDPDATTDKILAQSKQRQATTGLDAIFVDYVQIMNPADPKAPRVEQVSQITRDLKKIAKRLNVPVIVAAQLNRDVQKSGRKPRLSDLRESGSIEQDSDVVIMIHQKDEEDDGKAAFQVNVEIMVEKHRNGATFHCPCIFNKPGSTFKTKTVGGM